MDFQFPVGITVCQSSSGALFFSELREHTDGDPFVELDRLGGPIATRISYGLRTMEKIGYEIKKYLLKKTKGT